MTFSPFTGVENATKEVNKNITKVVLLNHFLIPKIYLLVGLANGLWARKLTAMVSNGEKR